MVRDASLCASARQFFKRRHHARRDITEEESSLFGEIGEHFSEEERESMGIRFETRKADLLAAM